MIDVQNKITNTSKIINQYLTKILSDHIQKDEISRPCSLMEAMRHGTLSSGKRLRPFFLIEVTKLLKGNIETAIYPACALELVHCYSLIHDDLPAMDDDDLRRGIPTVHKAFNEATAILAGDGLLTLAFDVLNNEECELSYQLKSHLTLKLARYSGIGGMVGGQILDMQLKKLDEALITTMQIMKTSMLFRFACEAGAIISGADQQEQELFAEFGSAIGFAFQLADDLLDKEGETNIIGKTTGKDERANKSNLIALYGIDWTRQQLKGLIKQAKQLLEPYGEKAQLLIEATNFIAQRSF